MNTRSKRKGRERRLERSEFKPNDEEDVQWQHNEVIQSTREKLVGEIMSSAVESLTGSKKLGL